MLPIKNVKNIILIITSIECNIIHKKKIRILHIFNNTFLTIIKYYFVDR